MTDRPIRDTPADATRIATAILRRHGCAYPDAVTAEILAALTGNHIGLTDLTPPEDPNADYHRPPEHAIAPPPATDNATPGLAEYQAAKANRPKEIQP